MIKVIKKLLVAVNIVLALAIISLCVLKYVFKTDTMLLIVILSVCGVALQTFLFLIWDKLVKENTETIRGAEQVEVAEQHIQKLQNYISEQEKNTQALKEKKEHFKHAAFHDPLTKLPNRNQLIDKLNLWIKRGDDDPNFGFTLLYIDLNRFKIINDSLGPSLGDELIYSVGERLGASVREEDFVARLGGDEFGILLNRVTDSRDVNACVELIVNNLAKPFKIKNHEIFTSASVGIVVSAIDYTKAEDMLRDADIAMYDAKKFEKDYVLFDTSMHKRAVILLQTETDLRQAIEQDEFCAYYQPIVNLNSMKLIGFEALIRWNHPTRGFVSPDEFIPVSEATNLIVPITIWMLRKSCQQLVEWKWKYPEYEDLIVSVNLSGKHFAQHDLVQRVKDILAETNMDPKHLKLEITESAVMESAESAIFMLKRLREIGVQLSIDDFGTGYSSFSYLHRFPIDTLKIDRTFVGMMEGRSENGEIVRTIIALAKALKLSVIAEGIETIHQLHQLRVLNCEYAQGYLFSRPVSSDQAEDLLKDSMDWSDIIPEYKANKLSATGNNMPTLEIKEVL